MVKSLMTSRWRRLSWIINTNHKDLRKTSRSGFENFLPHDGYIFSLGDEPLQLSTLFQNTWIKIEK